MSAPDPRTPTGATAVLRRTLEAFHGQRRTSLPGNDTRTVMVAELTLAQITDALTALATVERELAEDPKGRTAQYERGVADGRLEQRAGQS